jgi:hypothetical protein
MLTQAKLKEVLHYDPEAGDFTWLVDRGTRAKKGAVAGSPNKIHEYYEIVFEKKNYKAHRLAWLYVNGEFPEEQIDHINGVRTDNRISNLRAVGLLENLHNQKKRCTNSSGTTGVGWDKKANSWRVRINVNNQSIQLGSFADLNLAIEARRAAEKLYNFHPNHGRSA